MNTFIPKGPYTYRRSTDGCDETIDVLSRTTGEHVVAVHFWEAEDEANAKAQWITASLNLAHAVTELMAVQQGDGASTDMPAPRTRLFGRNVTRCRHRADRFATLLQGDRNPVASFVEWLTDAQHWCDREFVDFEDAVLMATRAFHSATNA